MFHAVERPAWPVLHHVTLKAREDPIGTRRDLAALLKARRTDMSHEELHRAAYAGQLRPTVIPDPRLPV